MDMFIQYIKEHGDEKCAELFRASRRAVASWRHGERRPSPKKAKEIARELGIPLSAIRPDIWDAVTDSGIDKRSAQP